MITQEGYFAGPDRTNLFARSWLPDEPPRAVVVLVHGLLEHSGRHAATARELVLHGFAVFAPDLRGHGRSDGRRCDIRSFDQYLLDLDIYFDRVRQETGNLPIFLMGNSMGGLLATWWTISRQPRISGLILSGALLALADGLFPWLRHMSAIAAVVAPRLRVARIPFEWLVRDGRAVDSYRDDPLMFRGRLTIRVAAEIHHAMKRLGDQAASLDAPLLILHGSQDRICSPGGCRALYEAAGSCDKTFHLYEGFYHEVFDESENQRVLADLTAWLDSRIPACDLVV
jgi:acylglycerol lipase